MKPTSAPSVIRERSRPCVAGGARSFSSAGDSLISGICIFPSLMIFSAHARPSPSTDRLREPAVHALAYQDAAETSEGHSDEHQGAAVRGTVAVALRVRGGGRQPFAVV